MNPTEFADIVRPIISRFNGSVTSGLRSVKRNEDVGGKEESRHLYDTAKDVVLDNSDDNDAFIKECKRQGLWAQLSNDGAIHVQGG
jgi:uncharacterized phosphosugar-binding protein